MLRNLSSVLLLLVSLNCYANDEQEALSKAGKALYYQLKLQDIVNKLDKKYTPKTVKEFGGWLVIVRQIASEKQLKYTWEW